MDSSRKREIERITALTLAGAERAAAAFAQLANGSVTAAMPVVISSSRDESPLAARNVGDEGTTGVFFEFEGCLDALVGILFPAGASEALVRSVIGIGSGPLDPEIVESALMEVGNILASHVASGIADALQSRLLPSIPALFASRAEREFAEWVGRVVGPDAPSFESSLRAADGSAVGRLVIVPTGSLGGSAS